MRLIDADALEKEGWSLHRTVRVDSHTSEYQVKPITKVPTIEPERKTGRWIDGHCSNCGCDIPAYIIDWKWQKDMDANFCPNCGAFMGGDTE